MFLLLVPIVRKNHLHMRRSSTLLLVFWPLYILALATWARTSHSIGWFDTHWIDLGLVSSIVAVGTILWILECVGPEHGPGAYHPIGKEVNESPFQTANIYSRWTYHWMGDLMRLGSKRPLEEEDVYPLGPKDQADVLAVKLEDASKKHSNLWVALTVAYGSTYAFAAVLKIIQDLLAFAQPQFLRMFLAYISRYQASSDPTLGHPPSAVEGFVIVGGMFISAVAQTIVLHQVGIPVYQLS